MSPLGCARWAAACGGGGAAPPSRAGSASGSPTAARGGPAPARRGPAGSTGAASSGGGICGGEGAAAAAAAAGWMPGLPRRARAARGGPRAGDAPALLLRAASAASDGHSGEGCCGDAHGAGVPARWLPALRAPVPSACSGDPASELAPRRCAGGARSDAALSWRGRLAPEPALPGVPGALRHGVSGGKATGPITLPRGGGSRQPLYGVRRSIQRAQ